MNKRRILGEISYDRSNEHYPKFQSIVSIIHVRELHPYVGLITFAAFSFAINLGFVLSKHLVFEYQDTSGVVGWVYIHQYPKQQEFFYYLLAVIGTPALMCCACFSWHAYSYWAAQWSDAPIQWMLKAQALASLPLCLSWITLSDFAQRSLMQLALPTAFFLLITLGILFWSRIKVPNPTLYSVMDQPQNIQTQNPFTSHAGNTVMPENAGKKGHSRLGNRVVVYLLIPMFIYLLTYQGKIHGGIDRFHEGELLAPLNEILRGNVPFRDIYLQHGLFQNALLPWLGSQLFEPTLQGVRLMRETLAPLGYISFYLLSLQIFRSRLFTTVISVLIASGIWVSPRYMLGLLAFTCVANYLSHCHQGRQIFKDISSYYLRFEWRLLLAGFFTSGAFWYSTEIGIYSFASLQLFLFLYSLRCGIPTRKSPLLLINYIGGVLVGLMPVGFYLLWHGALDDMLWNTYIQCQYQIATWGLPFPSLSETLVTRHEEGWYVFFFDSNFQYYLPICVFLIVSGYLTFRGVCRTLWQSEGMMKLLLLWIGGIVFFRTALGRSDPGHLAYGSTFFWMLCLLPIECGLLGLIKSVFYKHFDLGPAKSPIDLSCWHRVLKASWILIPTAMFLWHVAEVYQPLQVFQENWHRLTQNPFHQRVAKVELERAGHVDIPDIQAQQMKKVVAYIQDRTAPGEKIFDFSSQGAYYFFANRPSVTRYHQAVYAATPTMQSEVIAALEADKTRIVLFKTGGWFDAVDDVPAEQRHTIIAEYLQENYEPAVRIYRTQILQRKNVVGID